MPPRGGVHDLNERTFAQWYGSVPVVTRALFTCYMLTGTLLFFKVLPLHHMYHAWNMVFKLPVPEIWRLITNFMFIGGFSLNFLFQLVWLLKYGAAYESGKFLGNTADAIYMIMVGMVTIMLMDLVVPMLFGGYFHGPSIIFMLMYLWSKNNQNTPVSFFGVITFNAVYLPFAMLAIDVVQGASIKPGLVGILAGHMYYFLTEIYPRASGRHLIVTPQWLARLVYRYRLGNVPRVQVQTTHPTDTRFRAFSGAGRRLAD